MDIGSYFWNPSNYVLMTQNLTANENERKIFRLADQKSKNREIAKLASLASLTASVASCFFADNRILICSVAVVCYSASFWLIFDEEAEEYNRKVDKIIKTLHEKH
jgi:hypothetical protein